MEKKSVIIECICQQGILPLYFNKAADVSVEVLRALYAAGIRALEYTNRGDAALLNFKEMLKVRNTEYKDLYLGIGTIKNETAAQQFISAGADFIVSPGLVPSVVKLAEQHNLLWIPGCMTPSEIIQAELFGAKMIKLFPGNILGPGFMAAIKEIFPSLVFMPTGGVELENENIGAWFKAGVSAVGMGSKLITKPLLESKNYTQITADTERVLSIIKKIKS
jgi:2-dehydro-3-deoxyphosphogluconate aldolase / (4S)-4-hydroxy-2-oxoglutarate aldolase